MTIFEMIHFFEIVTETSLCPIQWQKKTDWCLDMKLSDVTKKIKFITKNVVQTVELCSISMK